MAGFLAGNHPSNQRVLHNFLTLECGLERLVWTVRCKLTKTEMKLNFQITSLGWQTDFPGEYRWLKWIWNVLKLVIFCRKLLIFIWFFLQHQFIISKSRQLTIAVRWLKSRPKTSAKVPNGEGAISLTTNTHKPAYPLSATANPGRWRWWLLKS